MTVMDWFPLESAPRDGTRIDVKCSSGVIVYDAFYGLPPIGSEIVLRGDQNVLSKHLVPTHWRPTITAGRPAGQKMIIRGEQI